MPMRKKKVFQIQEYPQVLQLVFTLFTFNKTNINL